MSRIKDTLKYAGKLPLKATGIYAGIDVFRTRYSSDQYSTALHVDIRPLTSERESSTGRRKFGTGLKAAAALPFVTVEAAVYSAMEAVVPTLGRLARNVWIRDDTYPKETAAAEIMGFVGSGAGLAADLIGAAYVFSLLPNPITSLVSVLGVAGVKMLVNLGEQVSADVVDAVATRLDTTSRRRNA